MDIVGAIDDSGDFEYLSIIIGDKEKVDSIAKTLPPNFTHMADYSRKDKKKILKQFIITGNIKICCIRYGFSDIRKKFIQKSKENVPNYKSNQKFGSVHF